MGIAMKLEKRNSNFTETIFKVIACTTLFSLFGCVTSQNKVKSDITYIDSENEVISEVQESAKTTNEGSLWQENGYMSEMFMDRKARRVGDIVTISVVETSSASNGADTSTSRSSSLSMQLSNLLGLENDTKFPSGSGFDPFGSITGSTSNSFSGNGTTNRSGNLAATITARVTQVLPNGNLKIVGKREITINDEKQLIALTGIIRPRDISMDNIILSTYIADARIAYTGTGIVSDKQNAGWFVRVLDTVWPF